MINTKEKKIWLPRIDEVSLGLEVLIEPQKALFIYPNPIFFNPIVILSAPAPEKLKELQEIAQEAEKVERKKKLDALRDGSNAAEDLLQRVPASKNKETKRALDLQHGNYIYRRFACIFFETTHELFSF